MVKDLDWEPLASRRKNTRLIIFYKNVHNLVKGVESDKYLNLNVNRTRSEASGLRYHKITSNYVITDNSYYPRTINDWNSLHTHVIASPSLEIFKLSLPIEHYY